MGSDPDPRVDLSVPAEAVGAVQEAGSTIRKTSFAARVEIRWVLLAGIDCDQMALQLGRPGNLCERRASCKLA
jgi:hypothetical protein